MSTTTVSEAPASASPPKPAYSPLFCMPVVFAEGTVVSLQEDSTDRLALHVLVEGGSLKSSAMVGGELFLLPQAVAEPTITLWLQVFVIDAQEMEGWTGIPKPQWIVYEHLDRGTVEAALQPLFSKQTKTHLQSVWERAVKEGPAVTGEGEPDLQGNLKRMFYLGKAGLAVKGGDLLGEVAVDAALSKPRLGIKMKDAEGKPLSSCLYLKLFSLLQKKPEDPIHPLIQAMDAQCRTKFSVEVTQWKDAFIPFTKPLTFQVASGTLEVALDPLGRGELDLPTSELLWPSFETVSLNASVRLDDGSIWSFNGWSCPADFLTKVQANYPKITINKSLQLSVGLAFNLRLICINRRNSFDYSAPKGLPVVLRRGSDDGDVLAELKTDRAGKVQGAIFNVQPGEKVYLEVRLEIEDNDIHLPRAVFAGKATLANVVNPLSETPVLWSEEINLQVVGDESVTASKDYFLENEAAEGLFVLKALRELSIFLHYLTDRDWTGVQDLVVYHLEVSSNNMQSFSWPVGQVYLKEEHIWDRETLVHEIAHQVMWKASDITTVDVAWQAQFNLSSNIVPSWMVAAFDFLKIEEFLRAQEGDYALYHATNRLTSTLSALYDGWADFMGLLFGDFTGYARYQYDPVYVTKNTPQTLLSTHPQDTGEAVEGAFARALLHIFRAGRTMVFVGERLQDIDEKPDTKKWLEDSKERFQRLIWNPLKGLSEAEDEEDKTTTLFLANIKKFATEEEWKQIHPDLKTTFNMGYSL